MNSKTLAIGLRLKYCFLIPQNFETNVILAAKLL